ncbi:HIRAN domain-containing protein [Bacillus sp. AFS031507]|uniref:HIRAN domain-containing protein n=1 Tax=Bacillus sp. AFS031507 TaxID=2033496 RepID=UPI00211E0685|nr:HIRAN domain-containing protein [Bacillus sp. AFS031507]
MSTWLAFNEQVKLKQEPTNPNDPHAVGIYTQGGKHLGYVPAFYSQAIFSLLSRNAEPEVRVIYINEKSTPHWWLKVIFNVRFHLLKEKLRLKCCL